MASSSLVLFTSKTGTTFSSNKIINLTYTKERYTPYTKVTGTVVTDDNLSDIMIINLKLGQRIVHTGIVDTLESEYRNGKRCVSFSSRGYTCALGQNQLTPGMYTQITFSELMTGEIALPNVNYQSVSTAINYVYIKDNDSMWDSAVAFCRKYNGDYPYVYGPNTIRVSRYADSSVITIPSASVISSSMGQDFTKMVSHLHMKDIEGTYNTYNMTNSAATSRSVIRHKQIPFDRQWLNNPTEALQSRIDFSNRGYMYKKLSYCGYNNEDLRKLVSVSTRSFTVSSQEISKLSVNLSQKGIITTLWFYQS